MGRFLMLPSGGLLNFEFSRNQSQGSEVFSNQMDIYELVSHCIVHQSCF